MEYQWKYPWITSWFGYAVPSSCDIPHKSSKPLRCFQLAISICIVRFEDACLCTLHCRRVQATCHGIYSMYQYVV